MGYGVFAGCVEILAGLWELWSAKSWNQLIRKKSKEHYPRAIGLIACGLVSIAVCALSGFQNPLLDALTFFAEMGVLILYGAFRDICRLRSCKMEVPGIFSHFSPTLGMMPVFDYRVGKTHYRGTSAPCNIGTLRGRLEKGKAFTIYVNEAKPSLFVLARKIEPIIYFEVPFGVALAAPLAVYLPRLFLWPA